MSLELFDQTISSISAWQMIKLICMTNMLAGNEADKKAMQDWSLNLSINESIDRSARLASLSQVHQCESQRDQFDCRDQLIDADFTYPVACWGLVIHSGNQPVNQTDYLSNQGYYSLAGFTNASKKSHLWREKSQLSRLDQHLVINHQTINKKTFSFRV